MQSITLIAFLTVQDDDEIKCLTCFHHLHSSHIMDIGVFSAFDLCFAPGTCGCVKPYNDNRYKVISFEFSCCIYFGGQDGQMFADISKFTYLLPEAHTVGKNMTWLGHYLN